MPRATSNGMTNRKDKRMDLYIPKWRNEFRDFAGAALFHFEYWDCALPTWGTNALRLTQHCDALGVIGAEHFGCLGTTCADAQRVLDRPRAWVRKFELYWVR